MNWTAIKLKKYKCLDLDMNQRIGMHKISIDFSDQCKLILRERKGGRLIFDIYFVNRENR